MVVAAKSISDPLQPLPSNPNPKSPQSTISTVTKEILDAGGEAIPLQVDVRSEQSVQILIDQVISVSIPTAVLLIRAHDANYHPQAYGRLDVLIYNSGAIYWASVASTPLKRFQLMQRVNPEGLYAVIQSALPHLHRSNGRIVVVSPPIYSRFFRGKTAYAMGKIGMSVLTKGLAMDLVREGRTEMAISSIWPAVVSNVCSAKGS